MPFPMNGGRCSIMQPGKPERLGLTFETHISNGFVAGGPWITKELGMQMLTASDTLIQGGKNFSGNLPLPTNTNDYYRDVAVLAFPVSREQWLTSDDIKPTVTSNLTELPAADLFSPNAPAVEILLLTLRKIRFRKPRFP